MKSPVGATSVIRLALMMVRPFADWRMFNVPSGEVEPMFNVLEVRVLKVPRVEKKLVVVALVPVELVKRIFEKFIFVPVRFVKTEFVENKLLVVALVPVALMKVKF